MLALALIALQKALPLPRTELPPQVQDHLFIGDPLASGRHPLATQHLVGSVGGGAHDLRRSNDSLHRVMQLI